MMSRIHAVAGGAAFLTILTFWTSTMVAELVLGGAAVATVKSAIVAGLVILIPAMAAAGISGAMLAWDRGGEVTRGKRRRMRLLAINGVLVMIPAALYLDHKAAAGAVDVGFAVVQVLELAVGAVQLVLLGRNFHDGLRLSGRFGSVLS